MSVPAWADEQLSQDLPQLRAKGEGQEMEFKREFPQQVTDVAKEVAAFATSNTGMIIFGVEDNGDLAGLDGATDALVRDQLLKRLEGVCSGSVSPAVTPQVAWAVEAEHVVLVLTVPKGGQPVYYSGKRPYLRHLTSSRPAEPHEVLELVERFLKDRLAGGDESPATVSAFLSQVGSALNHVLMWAETPADERHLNPRLEEWRAEYGQLATDIRQLAATDDAVEGRHNDRLRELADALDSVAAFRMYLGCGDKLEEVAGRASELAYSLKETLIDPAPLSEASLTQAATTLRESARSLADLASRTQTLFESGSIEDLQSGAGSIGYQLAQLSFYDLDTFGEDFSQSLREIGMSLRRLEVARIYMDGGASMQRIADQLADCSKALDTLVNRI